jgi:hypothetical protein
MEKDIYKLVVEALHDSGAGSTEGGGDTTLDVRMPVADGGGQGEVIVRKVVSDSGGDVIVRKVAGSSGPAGRPPVGDGSVDIGIGADGMPFEGASVTTGGMPVADGVYVCDCGGGEVHCTVSGGRVVAVADKAKTVIRGGKKEKIDIPTVKARLTPAQKKALAKAQKASQKGAAQAKRKKSFAKGKLMGLHEGDGVDVSTVDLTELGDNLLASVFTALADRFELPEGWVDQVEGMLGDDVCRPVVDGNKLSFTVPVWVELNGEVDLAQFDYAEFTYELGGTFDGGALLEALTGGNRPVQDSVVV